MLKDAERFFKVYSNLPLDERKKPIVILGKEPVSWDLAYEEIKNETEKGKKILNILITLDFI